MMMMTRNDNLMCDDIMMMNEWMDDACDDANECTVMVNIRFT